MPQFDPGQISSIRNGRSRNTSRVSLCRSCPVHLLIAFVQPAPPRVCVFALLGPLPRSHPILIYEDVTPDSNFAAGPLASDHPVSSLKLNLKNSAHVHLRTPTIHAHSLAVMLLRRPQPSIVVTVAGHRGGIETLPMAFESESVRVALS